MPYEVEHLPGRCHDSTCTTALFIHMVNESNPEQAPIRGTCLPELFDNGATKAVKDRTLAQGAWPEKTQTPWAQSVALSVSTWSLVMN
eukprot:4543936-Amphidinium_carterae.1